MVPVIIILFIDSGISLEADEEVATTPAIAAAQKTQRSIANFINVQYITRNKLVR